jgi:hypothetical protein
MPVHKILDEMPHEEMVGWFKYLAVRPYGWREDYRTFSLMASSNMSGSKLRPEEVFESLAVILKYQRSKEVVPSGGAIPSGNFLKNMLGAKGGDGFDFSNLLKE